ncbi:MAG: hypothetical protein QOJ64_1999 [Acidobacteriota bacterium]|jgi:hypothetical protein|nr:hypothetical protein [Acidobacteriota bacterium]
MADYKEKLDEWQRAARRKARELDEKFGLKDRVEEGARVAQDAARRGAETLATGADRVKAEAGRLGEEYELRDKARRAAEEAARHARGAGDAIRSAAGSAGEKAGEVFDGAKHYYERASRFASAGARFTRASVASTASVLKAREWVKGNPGKAAFVTFSIAAGARIGAAFPSLDAVLLGSHPHWFTHSALPVYALRKITEKYDGYLREREALVAEGKLTEAEQKRVEFERKVVKYVGAPLLGTFSCAAGVAMWAQIFQPGAITGAPISWILGGNPFLDGIWLFANGVLCFHQGYKFFMIALAGQDDVARVVREIRALLPAGEAA